MTESTPTNEYLTEDRETTLARILAKWPAERIAAHLAACEEYDQDGKTLREIFPEHWQKSEPIFTFRIPSYFYNIQQSPEV